MLSQWVTLADRMHVTPCPVPPGEKGARGAETTLASALMSCSPCNHSLGHPEHVMSVLRVSGTSLLFLPFPNLPQAGDEPGCLSSPCRQFRPLQSPPASWDWPRDGRAMEIFTLSSLGSSRIGVPAPGVPTDPTQTSLGNEDTPRARSCAAGSNSTAQAVNPRNSRKHVSMETRQQI